MDGIMKIEGGEQFYMVCRLSGEKAGVAGDLNDGRAFVYFDRSSAIKAMARIPADDVVVRPCKVVLVKS